MRRRALLATIPALAAGCSAVPPGTLPGGLADANTRRIAVPEVTPRIHASAAHVAAARDHLRAVHDDAEAAWSEADTSELDSTTERLLADGVETASNALEDTADERGTLQTLETVQVGVGAAAETLGGARWLLDEYDPDAVESEAGEIQAGVDALRDRVAYAGDDPAHALVWLRQVEFNARQAELLLPTEDAGVADADRPAEAAGSARSQVETSRRDLADGRRFYDGFRDGLSEPSSLAGRFEAAYDGFDVTAETSESRAKAVLDSRNPGEASAAVLERVHSHGGWFGGKARDDAVRYRDDGYLAYATVTAAEAVQRYRADEYATDALGNEVGFDADRIPTAAVSRAKRDAVAALRDTLDAHDGPLVRRFADAARRTVASGDRLLSREGERAEALGRYLLGAGLATYAPPTADEATR